MAAATDAALKTRSRVSYILMILAAAAIVGGVAYYGLGVIRASTFSKERAFRVLGEVAEQFQNLQGNLVGLLGNVSDKLKHCPDNSCAAEREQFARKLELKLQLRNIDLDKSVFEALCTVNDRASAFVIHGSEPNLPFQLFSCAEGQNATAIPEPRSQAVQTQPPQPRAVRLQLNYGLTGELTPSTEDFISQSFFDEVVVALDDGRVVAEVPKRERSIAPGAARLHESKIRLLSVTDATRLLRRAAAESRKAGDAAAKDGEAADDVAEKVSLNPVVFSDRLAGQTYNVFVVGFRLAYPTITVNGGGQPRQGMLYLVGLRRADLRAEILGALGPSGTFVVTVAIALIFFTFPLLSLRLKPARDPITWAEAAGCTLSLILLTALVAVTTVWVWSQQELIRWADDGARSYAYDIRRRLVNELGNDVVLLRGYRDEIYKALNREQEKLPDRPCWEEFSTRPMPSRTLPSAVDPGRADASWPGYEWPATQLGNPQDEEPKKAQQTRSEVSCNTAQLQVGNDTDKLKSWSPLRSNFAMLADGRAAGPRVTAYAVVPVKRDIELKDRAYFKALEREEQWRLPTRNLPPGQDDIEFVAQRLFNRGDGARVLQIAVPRKNQGHGAFDGLVSGDTRAHGLTAAIAPLFLKFAVINQEGAVLFHWDDSRSLTENFLVEAEWNSLLRSAVTRGRAGAPTGTFRFEGNYTGAAHRFFYLPLDGVPWGVVAFYPTSSVLELSSQAAISALVAYAAIVLLAVAAFVLIAVIVGRGAIKEFAGSFWPRPDREHDYEMWGLAATLGVVGFMLVIALPGGGGRIVAAIVIVLIGAVLLAASRYWKGHAYPMCISMLLIFGAALPAAWLALRYHDAQLEALVRSGLSGALRDIERRHAVIAHDLRRWQPDAVKRSENLPDAWTLAEHRSAMPVPGYEFGDTGGPENPSGSSAGKPSWRMTAFPNPPWANASHTPQLNHWLRYVWRQTASSSEQQQRTDLLRDKRSIDDWRMTASDGHDISIKADWPPVSGDTDSSTLPWLYDVLAAIVAIVVILLSSSLVSRRLLGARVIWPARYSGRVVVPDTPAAVVYHRSTVSADVSDILQRVTPIHTIGLATDSRFEKSQALEVSPGAYLFTDLDLAVIEPQRRQQILNVLEQLVRREDAELIITAHRSPLKRLHHPERYPEFLPGQEPGYAELIRWDSVMAKFREVFQPAAPVSQAELPTAKMADHHRAWKLCTRDERLALYQLATGKLANPENEEVLGVLIRHGLVTASPLPAIVDPDFRRFVSTAEAATDIASWQRDASRSAWKTARAPVIGGLLVLLLIAVVWFSWAGGETFKVFSTVIVAAVALLGQLTSAFNFVRTPGSSSKS